MLKKQLKKLFLKSLDLKPVNFLVSKFLNFSSFVNWHVQTARLDKIENEIRNKVFEEPKVLNGPFKDLKYPNYESFYGSRFLPKLIGSYEMELHGLIEEMCQKKPYTEILNIGCGEGYFAVGFALRMPNTKIIAYDLNEKARTYCNELIKTNGVEDRVEVQIECTTDILENFKFTGRGLIFSDCEGAEKILFNSKTISNLKNCDILIEVHDFIDIEISDYLVDAFKDSHDLTVIYSNDDYQKVKNYNFEIIKDLKLWEKKIILSEYRPSIMEWYFFTPKVIKDNKDSNNKVEVQKNTRQLSKQRISSN